MEDAFEEQGRRTEVSRMNETLVDTLLEIISDSDEVPEVRLTAINLLLERW